MNGPDEGNLERFCRQIEERSRVHREAMPLVAERGLWPIAASILRQELDSLIRVIFLLRQPSPVRDQIIATSLAGDGRFGLPNKKGTMTWVTDGVMLRTTEAAANLDGWPALVYDFGCRFIHLSNAHDYLTRDPFQALPLEERGVIVGYLRKYHKGSVDVDSTFDDVARYLPSVLKKISENLSFYLANLRNG